MNKIVLGQLDTPKSNFIEAEKDIKEVVSYLRAYREKKKFSIYWLFSCLSIELSSPITEKDIKCELDALNKNLEDKSLANSTNSTPHQ